MRPFLKYFAYVVRHKRFVYQEGRKLGLGRWQLLKHDWHKFLPDEFVFYALHFNTNLGVAGAFDQVWLNHQRRSKHHWQAWVLREDNGKTKVLPMPDRYRREMLADWRGAGRAIHGEDETLAWYIKTTDGRLLHPDTQTWIETQLGIGPRSFVFELEPLKRESP